MSIHGSVKEKEVKGCHYHNKEWNNVVEDEIQEKIKQFFHCIWVYSLAIHI